MARHTLRERLEIHAFAIEETLKVFPHMKDWKTKGELAKDLRSAAEGYERVTTLLNRARKELEWADGNDGLVEQIRKTLEEEAKR